MDSSQFVIRNEMSHLQIAYFLAVVKFGGFSEAARNLFVAQSAISKQIQMLETKLDMQLFIRVGKSISLTPAGEILYKNLSNYNDWLWQIIDMAKSVDRGMVGVLHIGIQHGLNLGEETVSLIHRFSKKHPGIEINLRRVSLVDMMQNLNVGTLDIVIALSFLVTASEKEEFACYVLDTTTDQLLVSKNHPLGKLNSFCVDDFLNHKFVTVSPNVSRGAYENSTNYLRGLGIEPVNILYVPTIEDIMMGIEYGLAYGIASPCSRLSTLESIRFIDGYSEFSKPPRHDTEILAMWRKSTSNRMPEMLIDFLKAQNPEMAYDSEADEDEDGEL